MLTGDLTDFTLRDLLRLLATTGKSGVLELRMEGSEAGIFVRDGHICLALLDVDRIPGLAARMIRAGLTDIDQIRTIGQHRSADTAAAVASALGHAVADRARAENLYAEHTYEAVGWLAHQPQGTFRFAESPTMTDWPFAPLDVDAVFAEVQRRDGEWSELRSTVGDLSLIGSLVPDTLEPGNITLTPDQWRVVAFIDGSRAVKDIVELSGMGYLETCRELQALTSAGLIELVPTGEHAALGELVRGLLAPRPLATVVTPVSAGLSDIEVPTPVPTPPRPGADTAPAEPVHATEVEIAAVTTEHVDGGRTEHVDGGPTDEDLSNAEVLPTPPIAVADDGQFDAAELSADAADVNRGLLQRLIGDGETAK